MRNWLESQPVDIRTPPHTLSTTLSFRTANRFSLLPLAGVQSSVRQTCLASPHISHALLAGYPSAKAVLCTAVERIAVERIAASNLVSDSGLGLFPYTKESKYEQQHEYVLQYDII